MSRPDQQMNRPGHQANRPGYQQNRPGYQGNRPGYQPHRRGFQGNRPGYHPNRPGYQVVRPSPPVVYPQYQRFNRGDRLPPQFRQPQYVVNDWRGHRLQQPPRGYYWVQNGSDYVLAAIATGLISAVVINALTQ